MEIRVKLSQANEIKRIRLEAGSTVESLLNKFKLKPDTLIVMSKNKPIPVDSELNDGQELAIISVASGG